jgi:hypothetical protein
MSKHRIRKNGAKYYSPDAQIVRYFRENIDLKERLNRVNEEEHTSVEIEKKKAALATLRTRILDKKIFQAMADLTFFFSAVGKYPMLRKELDSPIKELLGVRRDNPREIEYGFTFWSLVGNMLLVLSGRAEADFRLRLTHELQRLIWYKVNSYRLNFFESEYTQQSIAADFGRVIGWTEMLMRAAERDEYRIPEVAPVRRKEYGGPTREQQELIKKREKSYQQDLKSRYPHRTFDFGSIADIVKI